MSDHQLPPREGLAVAEAKAIRADLRAAARLINPEPCQIVKHGAQIVDPYGLFDIPDKSTCYGRVLFVRNPPDGPWVYEGDLPDDKCKVLDARITRERQADGIGSIAFGDDAPPWRPYRSQTESDRCRENDANPPIRVTLVRSVRCNRQQHIAYLGSIHANAIERHREMLVEEALWKLDRLGDRVPPADRQKIEEEIRAKINARAIVVPVRPAGRPARVSTGLKG